MIDKRIVQTQLDELADLRQQIEQINQQYNQLRDERIGPGLLEVLEAFEVERSATIDPFKKKIKALEDEIKEGVLKAGKTIQGARLQAVYAERSSWDNAKLEGYAVAHPEILALRQLTPYISIKATF